MLSHSDVWKLYDRAGQLASRRMQLKFTLTEISFFILLCGFPSTFMDPQSDRLQKLILVGDCSSFPNSCWVKRKKQLSMHYVACNLFIYSLVSLFFTLLRKELSKTWKNIVNCT